jgi:hypothetical protein
LITEELLNQAERNVVNSRKYGSEYALIGSMLEKFPKNDDLEIIAMKCALIDITNSTQIGRQKSKASLYDLAKHIKDISDIDQRLQVYDEDLVEEIAYVKTVHLVSFASKFCTYHNYNLYKRDDYSIFDSVVEKNIKNYCGEYHVKMIEKSRWRQGNYIDFRATVTKLLKASNTYHVQGSRRKIDWLIWWDNLNNQTKQIEKEK